MGSLCLERASSPLCAALARQCGEQGRAPALISEGERAAVTFSDLARRIGAWSRAFQEAGVSPGSLAALATGNVLAFSELFFALRSLGVAVLALDGALEPPEKVRVCRRLGVQWLLSRDGESGGAALQGVPDGAVRLASLHSDPRLPAGAALVKLTSGSTLEPRGACFTEEALLEGIGHIREGMELDGSDRVLIAIPLSHSYGFDNGVLSLAAIGTPLVLQQDPMPAAIRQSLQRHEITFFPAVPALVAALAKVAWPMGLALRKVISASAPLSRDAAGAFATTTGLPVHQFFGATECGGISFERSPSDPKSEGTVGHPMPGVRIELDSRGTLRVHSKANRFALIGGASRDVSAAVETGDRGAWTAEGRLRLLGRAQLFAKIGGYKVDLGSLETFLRGLPGVHEAAAVAVEDPARGHRVVAYVESPAQTSEAVLSSCREGLSAREVPSEVVIVRELPRTARGKVDRAALGGGR